MSTDSVAGALTAGEVAPQVANLATSTQEASQTQQVAAPTDSAGSDPADRDDPTRTVPPESNSAKGGSVDQSA